MSRLYAWLSSDTNKSERTITGNEIIECTINYGSSGNSMRAIRIAVQWIKGDELPTVYINKGDRIK